MTIGLAHSYEVAEEVPQGKRLRMRDWLKTRIGNPKYPGLVWLDKDKNIFRIPWKHAALHGWDQKSDGGLFRDWAEHTGSGVKGAYPKQLKATFRCALHSLPDVHEIRDQAKKRGDDACRVYKFDTTGVTAQTKRRLIRIRNHKEKERISRKKQFRMSPTSFSNNSMHGMTPYPNTPFCNWESPPPHNHYSTHDTNINASKRYGFHDDEYFDAQGHAYFTHSNADISHALLPPPVVSYLGFNYQQHAQSVPDFSCSSIANPNFVYGMDMEGATLVNHKMEKHRDEHFYISPAHDQTLSPKPFCKSPIITPMTPSSGTLSPHVGHLTTLSLIGQNTGPIPTCAASESQVHRLSEYNENAPLAFIRYYGQDGVTPLTDTFRSCNTNNDSVISVNNGSNCSPALQRPTYSTFPCSTSLLDDVIVTTEPQNFTYKSFHQVDSENETAIEDQIRQMYSIPFMPEQPKTHHVLENVPNDITTQDRNEATDVQMDEGTNTKWIGTTFNSDSTLPSAYTLLTPSNSPKSKKDSLKWISASSTSSPCSTPSIYIQETQFSDQFGTISAPSASAFHPNVCSSTVIDSDWNGDVLFTSP